MTAHSFNGYNVCIFAYGQTGSGKSYTMMGTRSDPGLIPKLCNELFTRITSNAQSVNFSVEVSYMEIYCERVRDLLNPSSANKALRVREHPIMGPYVEGLSKLAVKDYTDVAQIMDDGNKTRTVAATNMNATSSRSHAVFSLIFSQRSPDDPKKINKVSKISLVDLAGSERANSTGASGTRLKEGANINQSLTTLGKVISALAEAPPDVQGSTKRRKKEFVPYRDSVLTWLLKESLGGNSKTAMIAAVSPADINYEETLSTLRYADRAKRIRCHAVVNEDPNAKLVRELRAEVERLKTLLVQANPEIMNPPDEEDPAPNSSRAEAMIESGPDGAEDEREKTLQDLQESVPKKSTSQLEMFLATEKAAERRGSATQTSPQGTGETQVKSSLSCAEEEGTTSSPDLETIKSIAAGIDTITLAKRSRHASVVDGSDADQQAQTIKVLKQLEESENLINELSEPWEVKLKRSEELRSQRMAILKEMGVALRDDTSVSGVFSPKSIPHLVNLNEDPFMSECLLYYLKVNAVTYVGTATLPADIVLSGTGITSRHAVFEYVLKDGHGEVFLSSCPEANTFVNGRLLEGRMKLKTGSRIIFGAAHVFRFVHPTAENCDETFVDDLPPDEPDNLAEVDWEYATKEIMDQWGIDLKAEKMEMHMKLQEAHSKLEEEQERAAIALEIQREEYEKKIKSLEFQVNIALSEARGVLGWTPRQIRLAKYSWDKWRKYQFTSLRDQIWGHAVLIKEANAIAAELNKQVEFQFSLLRDGLYTPIPSDSTTPNPGQSVLVVEVRDKLHGALHYWSLEKLQVRLDGMRKMYELASEPKAANKEPNFPTNSRKSSIASDVSMPVTPKRVLEPIVNPMHQLHPDDGSLERPQWLRLVGRLKSASMSCLSEAGGRLMSPSSPISPHVPMSPQIDMANSATGMETALFSLLSSSDAFYDRTPWFNPIGRGSQPLYHLIPSVQDQEEMVSFQHRVRIISGHGELKGAVLIKTESLPKAEIANVGCIILLGDEALSDDGAEWSPDNGSTFSGEEELKFPIGERVIEGCSSPEGQAALYEEDDDNTTVWGLRLSIETFDLLPEEYSDAFCQFTIFGRCEESWSTEPIPISAGSATANATWELAVRAGSDLIRALRTTSIVLEVFGHSSGSSIPPFPHRFTDPDPAISFLPAFSKPVPVSSLYGPGGINQGGQTHSRHDILAWFELLELDVSGDYKAVPVEHGPERSRGMFLLHHGVQRKVALTITHESSAHLRWAEVCEVVVGRVRAREDGQSGMGDMPLSLPVTTSMCSQFGGDRTCYRVEAVWDSSLHNSDLLNRPGGQIWLTISAYVDLQQCTQPVCISRDVCVQVFPRDARLGQCRSLRQLLSPRNGIPAPSTDANRISSIFEISLRYQNLSPRSSRPILDTASQYVKGEEYLTSWRPKWDGLILEHQNLLRRLQHLQDLEKIRHWLHANDVDYPVSQRGMFGPTCQPGTFEPFQADQELDEDSYTPEETATLKKALGLMFHKFPSVFVQNSYFATSSNCQSNGDGDSGLASVDSLLSNSPSLSSMRSRASDFTSMSCLTIPLDEPLDPPLSSPGVGPSTSSNNVSNQTRQMIPCVESVVMNPVISRRGYLLVLEQGSSHWTRRFVVVRRPYLLFYRSARDPVERSVINLSTAVVEYSADKQDVFRTPYIFAVSTQARALLLAAGSEAEANGWLYAFNPLLAASKKYYEMGHSSRLAEK